MSGAARKRGSGFRRRDALHRHSLHFGPNMTPMVDIVMVILVFFMASAAFVGPEWFVQALLPREASKGGDAVDPSGKGAGTPTEEPIRLTIRLDVSASGETLADGQGLSGATIDSMGGKLAELSRGLNADDVARRMELLIVPTAKVPYRDVVRMHELATRAGIQRVGYATP